MATVTDTRERLTSLLQVDSDSVVPLYQQIGDQLLSAVDEGRLAPGDPLPPERELAELFGISRMTVRKALIDLRARGYLTSRVGKGWYVGSSKITQSLSQLRGFSGDMRSLGHTVRSKVLKFVRERASAQVAARLGISPGEPVYCLERLRLVDGEPLGLAWLTIPHEICPGLDAFDFSSDSLYRVMEEEYGLVLTQAEQEIGASLATADEASLLDIEPSTPVLCATRVTYDAEQRVVEAGTAVYRGDRYKYRINLDAGLQQGVVMG